MITFPSSHICERTILAIKYLTFNIAMEIEKNSLQIEWKAHTKKWQKGNTHSTFDIRHDTSIINVESTTTKYLWLMFGLLLCARNSGRAPWWRELNCWMALPLRFVLLHLAPCYCRARCMCIVVFILFEIFNWWNNAFSVDIFA